MFPHIDLGPISIASYGGLIALGFLAGTWVMVREGRRAGIPAARMLDLAFWVVVAGFLGARLLFLATNPGYFRHPFDGGFAFYGGVPAAALAAILTLRRAGVRFWPAADAAALGLSLAHFFGRMGCFAVGCCYGRPAAWGGVSFGPGSLALAEAHDQGRVPFEVSHTAALYPTQLWEAAAELALFAALVWLAPRKRFHGQLLAVWLTAYAVARAIIEHFRGDASRGRWLALSTSQWLAGLMLLAGLAILVSRTWRARPAPARSPAP